MNRMTTHKNIQELNGFLYNFTSPIRKKVSMVYMVVAIFKGKVRLVWLNEMLMLMIELPSE